VEKPRAATDFSIQRDQPEGSGELTHDPVSPRQTDLLD